MRWRGERQSDNVEDRRGMRVSRGVKVGGISGLGLVAIVVVSLLLGVDPTIVLQQVGQSLPSSTTIEESAQPAANNDMRNFVAVVLAETEDVWNEQFNNAGRTYQEPKLVLFSGAVDSACGFAQSAMGPFYCPADHKIYLDLEFFNELHSRFGASGDFAQAYVIAHEIGHHVQTQLGIIQKVAQLQARSSKAQANKLSVLISCRRIAWPVCGRIRQAKSAIFWKKVISKKPSMPRAPWVMTTSRKKRGVTWCPIPLRTAVQPSA